MKAQTEGKQHLNDTKRIGVEILEAYHHLTNRALEFFKTYDLTPQQHNVMAILHHAGKVSTSDILKWMYEKNPGVSRLVDRLLKKGLVEKSANTQDKRLVVIGLTPKGQELYNKVEKEFSQMESNFDSLSSQEMQTLIGLLVKLKGF
ncbi:MarR family winged helix-turn-helix transcriptional regulator [Sphingobacterium corticis]|uniref:MarR family winged helix-turn-helix transcriptional regulator n=1 Tax=Sphingobacterium corticis TaxID=1812823 RepID=A0ABW5NIZ3_9SPHI